MSSSSTAEVCFNSNCKETSEKWRRGWRRRTGEYAHLCDRCASAYEDGKFCETFHMNASGWRCCESCGKQIHCGCIVSFHMFVLLDAGGIECLTCAKRSFILTPNPAWPPPLHFLPSQPERMKDLSIKSWSPIAGSGPVPWRQAPSLFNSSSIQANVQLRMADVLGGIDRYNLHERLYMASPENKQERPYERLAIGKLRLGLSETIQNGNIGLNVKEQNCPFISDCKPYFPRNDTSTNQNLVIASSSKSEIDDTPLSAILTPSSSIPSVVGKPVYSQSGIDSTSEAHIRNGKSRLDGRSRNQLLLPRYRPRITDEMLQQFSGDSKSVIVPLFEKMLSASDAGRVGRLVLPKKCAEAYFPPINNPEGLALNVQDIKGKEWVFQFRFWPNNNSRMYVLEGITPCIQSMNLQAGDVVTFSRLEPEGKLIMGGRKSSTVPSPDLGEEDNTTGNEAASPGDANAGNRSTDVMSVNGHMKEKILEHKPAIHVKRKNTNLNAKSKRLRIENDDMMELKLTYKEAQRLMRVPAKVVPSSFVVDGCEFEEFEETGPVIGRPTLMGIDDSGEKIQWVQCEDCFKWRKVPANALVHSKWTCSDNVWDVHRSQCSSAEELTNEQLEQMLSPANEGPPKKEESCGGDADLYVAMEGLDALANLAIQGEGEALRTSPKNKPKVKHPRHRPGCTCIVCLQPPSGKGSKHPQSCDCVVCTSLKRRFRTMMERRERERKQSEKETQPPSSSHNLRGQNSHENEHDAGNRSSKEEEVRKSGNLEEPDAKISSTSPLKAQIDLNIQPEREEDISPNSDFGAMKCSMQRSLESEVIGNLLGKTMQQDGVGRVGIINCVALDGGHKKTG